MKYIRPSKVSAWEGDSLRRIGLKGKVGFQVCEIKRKTVRKESL